MTLDVAFLAEMRTKGGKGQRSPPRAGCASQQDAEIISVFEAVLDRGGFGGYLSRLVMVGFTGHNWSAEASRTLGMIKDLPLTSWFVNSEDESYPAALRALGSPPERLWGLGLPPPRPGELEVLAVVGSRGVSKAGCEVIERIAADLVGRREGGIPAGGPASPGRWAVISGGALGIDAAAHRGALGAGGRTWAVLGCGIDVVYPDRHAELFARISTQGGLLSEYGPGVPPRAGQFPARNRLVAALARAVLVGESRRGSGALITARAAAKLGRPIFAVPGSFGTDGLIESGVAWPVDSASALLEALSGRPPCPIRPPWRAAASGPALGAGVSADVFALIACLGAKGTEPDRIASELGWPLGRTLAALSEAELAGQVRRGPGGKFEVNLGD